VTLTTRLSIFFLATLALVLVGFSAALFLLAKAHLYRQSEERLAAALNTLVAAAEIRPDGVEWEPAERRLDVGPGPLGGQVVWLVSDDRGQVVDQSARPGAREFLADAFETLRTSPRSGKRLDWQGERWECGQRCIRPDPSGAAVAAAQPPDPHDGQKYPALFLTAAVSLEPVRAALRQLFWVLAGLSLWIWIVALIAGRFVCRRALLPVTCMAVAAREMGVDDLGQRLPIFGADDELENLSRAFNNLLDRLQDSFQRQQRFTGDASHQLRTPLTAMLGQLEVALRRERPAEEYRRVLTTVQRQAGHLRRIVESLLFLTRADHEARLPNLERIPLKDWLAAHLQAWSGHARASDIHCEPDAAGEGPVEAQPVLLGELVNILLDNACKFSRPGTPIQVRLRRDREFAYLDVQDQGFGIQQADLSHLFTPFFRSADARMRGVEGTGLGLSIAQRLARAFGGSLTVTSRVGEGSCFTLRLNLVEAAEPAFSPACATLSAEKVPGP
jgi:heavy metal sensor kinase